MGSRSWVREKVSMHLWFSEITTTNEVDYDDVDDVSDDNVYALNDWLFL